MIYQSKNILYEMVFRQIISIIASRQIFSIVAVTRCVEFVPSYRDRDNV